MRAKKSSYGNMKAASRGRRRKLLWIVPGLLLGGLLFREAYRSEPQVTAASTGYNATARGLCAWDETWAEHDEGNWSRVARGRRIHYGALILEIFVCAAAGMVVTRVVAEFLTPRPSRPWE